MTLAVLLLCCPLSPPARITICLIDVPVHQQSFESNLSRVRARPIVDICALCSEGFVSPMLRNLLGQVWADEAIASVTADGACDTRGCRDAIANRGADAVIPPLRNAKRWKKHSPGATGRNEALRAIKRLGRTSWRRWSRYHHRSHAETKINCMKLLGHKLMARDFDGQTVEVQVRIAIFNRYTALGIPVTQPIG